MRLLDKRYEEIKKIVVELFTELNLYDVPIDCFKICEMLGIVVMSVCSMIKHFQSVHYSDFSTRISDKK